MSSANKSIGVRLNNPGTIEWGSPWQGLVPREQSMYFRSGNKQQRRFAQFKDPVSGIRAIAVTLITYQDKRRAKDGSKIDSAREIVERWAPATENNVTAYAHTLAVALGKAPDDESVDMHDYAQLKAIVQAIIRHENTPGPLKTPNTWYTDAQIDEALRRAGVPRPARSAVPVTPETLGASATGALGVAQLAEAAPPVLEALDRADSHLSSGSVVRVAVGVTMVVIAVIVAWAQIRRRVQTGEL